MKTINKFRALALLTLTSIAMAQDLTLPPASARRVFVAEGRGVQIYQCTNQDGVFAWTFQSPEATLFDPTSQHVLGKHGAGPTWTWADGSTISGKVLQKSPSPDPGSIPWLLLSTTPSGATTGALTPITLVRRSDTHGGDAPATGCDAQHISAVNRMPYSATYTFYITK
jgi:hypothetical protein